MSDPSRPRDGARFALLLACFFLSGFAALIYQTAWMRQFSFVFGTSELAVATVLAAYMAGLALGAAVIGRLGRYVRRPVRAYALLELGIAVGALLVPVALSGALRLYVATFGGAAELPDAGGLSRALFYLACSFGILLVPTALMGATLPLLTRHAVRSEREIGTRVGALYATNTLGAVCGTVVTGFVLLPSLGLGTTIRVAIAANVVVFGAAAWLSRVAPVDAAAEAAAAASGSASLWNRWILPLALLSGAVSFTYEVVWTRLLGHVLGGSVYAFATMLASFLVGIAAGSAVASRFARDAASAARGFAWAQLGVAGLSLLAFRGLDYVPALALALKLRESGVWADALVSALALLPSTLCIGATFPFAVRVLARDERGASVASARVFAWNTTGAVLGAVGAGFFVVPALGYEGTVALAVGTSLALAAAAAWGSRPRRRGVLALAAAGGVALLLLPPAAPWQLLRSSPLTLRPLQAKLVHFAVGRSATVMLLEEGLAWRLRTNGLPEALISGPGSRRSPNEVEQWLAALGSLLRPGARSMLVVGLGGGVVLESVPTSVERIDVVELEPAVVEANRVVAARRQRDPLADPRVRVVENDARGALMLAGRDYDVIVSQPSHPWTAGASHLYTREFFELVREHLSPDGVFVQWMGLSFVDASLTRTLVATLDAAFPHVRVYRPQATALLFAASASPFPERFELPTGDAAERLGLRLPEDLAGALLLDEAGARAFATGALVSTDDRNELAMRSPALARIPRQQGRLDPGIDEALHPHDALRELPPGLDRVRVSRDLLLRGRSKRAVRVANENDGDSGLSAQAMLSLRFGNLERAESKLERLRDPDAAPHARALRLLLQRARDGVPSEEAATALAEPERSVALGWRYTDDADWDALRGLEPRLAAIDPSHLLYPDALRMRARWRLAAPSRDQGRVALALVDESLTRTGENIPYMVLRSRAALAAGDLQGSLSTLLGAAQRMRPQRAGDRRLAAEALEVVSLMPRDEETRELRTRIAARLRRVVQGPRPRAGRS